MPKLITFFRPQTTLYILCHIDISIDIFTVYKWSLKNVTKLLPIFYQNKFEMSGKMWDAKFKDDSKVGTPWQLFDHNNYVISTVRKKSNYKLWLTQWIEEDWEFISLYENIRDFAIVLIL